MTYLGSKTIKKLILEKGLVQDYIDLNSQLQPNGFDMTVQKIERVTGKGTISTSGKMTPILLEIPTDDSGFWNLKNGLYIITFNEILNFPKGIAGIGIQRSTIARCGAIINVSSWDSGYEGRGQNLLVVHNKNGLVLQKNSRVVQMHFIRISGENFLYNGNYQKENINKRSS